ncbi:hypothetical protein ACFLWH_01755 [Chloroflexota bacterium]
MTETKGDEIEQVMQLLGRSVEEQCLASVYCAATYQYIVYEVLREEFGPDKGSLIAVAVPFAFGEWAAKVALKQLGLEDIRDVKDLPTIAKLFQKTMNVFGHACVITECSDERAVVDMTFCKNCMLGIGPWDRYIDRVRYYYETEASREIGYGKFCADFPDICGLGKKVTGRLVQSICLGEGSTCRIVFESISEEGHEG